MKAPSGLAPLEQKFSKTEPEEESAGARGRAPGLHLARIHLQREISFAFAALRLNYFTRGASPRGSGFEGEGDSDNTSYLGSVHCIHQIRHTKRHILRTTSLSFPLHDNRPKHVTPPWPIRAVCRRWTKAHAESVRQLVATAGPVRRVCADRFPNCAP